jgi:Holliday junction resolvase
MSYKSGRSFEYRARDVFREYGYNCDRKAASSPYDLLVQKDGRTLFLGECKKTGKNDYIYIKKEDIDKTVSEAEKQKAMPLVLYGFRRTPVFVALPEELAFTGKMYKVAKGSNRMLCDLLNEFKEGKRQYTW